MGSGNVAGGLGRSAPNPFLLLEKGHFSLHFARFGPGALFELVLSSMVLILRLIFEKELRQTALKTTTTTANIASAPSPRKSTWVCIKHHP